SVVQRRGHRVLPVHRRRRGAPPAGPEDHRRVRGARRAAQAPEPRYPQTMSEAQHPLSEAPASGVSALRALSPRAHGAVERLGQLCDWLSAHPPQSGDIVTRPHPLLGLVRRGPFLVLLAPASVWDKGRDLFAPYLDKFAAVEARLALLGRPSDPDLSQALNLGLC